MNKVQLSPADHATAERITDEIMAQIRSEPQTNANWFHDAGKFIEGVVKKHGQDQKKKQGRNDYMKDWHKWHQNR